MQSLNPFIWKNYIESEQGKKVIELFDNYHDDICNQYIKEYWLKTEDIGNIVAHLYFNSDYDEPEIQDFQSAQDIFQRICETGIVLFDDNDEPYDYIEPDFTWYIDHIVPISYWLYLLHPHYFKPYFFIHNADMLMKIADGFNIELPATPKKSDKKARFEYYWEMCQIFHKFEQENHLTPAEMCAFLYDFCFQYFENQEQNLPLPQATQVWFVGGNKVDFDFLDNFQADDTHFWQSNLDTKRGDIIVMYCLAPRSYIHSIWRAQTNGIASPFFHWYSSIHIQSGQKITPISLNQLKTDPYFSQNKLVKKNFQGVNGYPVSSEDYHQLLKLIQNNGDDLHLLPQIYAPNYAKNIDLKNEKDVELQLIEPFLMDLNSESIWTRQLTVKMGRSEKVFPDYALLSNSTKGYEQACILLEAKFDIRNNQELEQAFRQVWSYGLRLQANLLIIADKNAIWLYEKNQQGFDRNRYHKFFWKELENPDQFNQIKKLITLYFPKNNLFQ